MNGCHTVYMGTCNLSSVAVTMIEECYSLHIEEDALPSHLLSSGYLAVDNPVDTFEPESFTAAVHATALPKLCQVQVGTGVLSPD